MLTIKVALWLRNHFKDLSDQILADSLGISTRTLQLWRNKLKLIRGHKDKWKMFTNGMLGKSHTKSTLKKMSRHKKKRWKDPNHAYNSKAYRQKIGDTVSRGFPKRKKQNMYSHAKRGYRKDISKGKIFFRSAWEANYARYLDYLVLKRVIKKWEFEPDTFWFEKIKRGVRSYCPDFKVWDYATHDPYYVEIKGYMDARSKTKIKRMAKYYPLIELQIIDSREYMNIKHVFSSLIKNWE